MQVQIVMFDGVEELDAVPPYKVFASAGSKGASIEVKLVALDAPRIITGSNGIRFEVTEPVDVAAADVLLVPGGGFNNPHAARGVRHEIERGVLPAMLREAVRPGLTIASVCTGATLLGAAGLAKGRPCTTDPDARAALEADGGLLIPARVVDDGDLVTCGAVTSGLDLALWLVEREVGPQIAVEVERGIAHERRGTVWRSGRTGGASPDPAPDEARS